MRFSSFEMGYEPKSSQQVVLTKFLRFRPQLMFFEMTKLDPLGTDSWKRSTDSELVSTFAGHQDMFANLIAELDPDARMRKENGQQSASLRVLQANVTHDANAMRIASIEIPKLLPDGYVPQALQTCEEAYPQFAHTIFWICQIRTSFSPPSESSFHHCQPDRLPNGQQQPQGE